MREEHLTYFKDLLEGRATISWRAWFKQNESQLASELPRAAFLRLKFKHLDEAEDLLRAAGVEYNANSTAARRERYYAALAPSVLDEHGRPIEAFRRTAYNGAIGKMLDGEWQASEEILQRMITKVRRKSPQRQAEELNDMCFDGEMEYTLGNREIGRRLLSAVASVPQFNDLVDPATDRARELLKESEAESE